MKSNVPPFFFAVFFATLSLFQAVRGETLRELLDRFDKDGDGRLNEAEFAEALTAKGIRVQTAAGEERVKAANKLFNTAATKYPDSQLRYNKRAAETLALTNKLPEWLNSSDLERLTTYEKFVVKRAETDSEIAKDEATPTTQKEGSEPAISFLSNNFRVRDKIEGINGEPVSDHPAMFSWTHARGENSFYTIDAGILYTPAWLNRQWQGQELDPDLKGWDFSGRIRPGFEAHVSTEQDATLNQLKYAVLLEARRKWFPGGSENARTQMLNADQEYSAGVVPFISAHSFGLEPVYVTDQAASVRAWGADFRYEPSIPFFNLNHDSPRPLFRLSWLEGSMKGHLGLAFRQYEQGKPATMSNANYGELTGGYEGSITVLHRVTLSADYSATSNLWGDTQSHDLFEGKIEFLFDTRNFFTVGFKYTLGELDPTFKKVDTITAWVGIKL